MRKGSPARAEEHCKRDAQSLPIAYVVVNVNFVKKNELCGPQSAIGTAVEPNGLSVE